MFRDPYNLLGTALSAVLCGIFAGLLCMLTIFLASKDSLNTAFYGAPTNHPFYRTIPFIGGSLLFATTVSDWVLRAWDALIGTFSQTGGPVPSIIANPQGIGLALDILFFLAPVIGDSIMVIMPVYRLWTIWNHKRLIPSFAAITLGAGTTCGVAAICVQQLAAPHWNQILSPKTISDILLADIWNMGFLVLTVMTNLYCCAMISWKICQHLRNCHPHGRSPTLKVVLSILIESIAIYTVFIAAFVAASGLSNFDDSPTESFNTWLSRLEAAQVLSACFLPITGITFTLINVRLEIRYAAAIRPTSVNGPGDSEWSVASHGPDAGMSFAESTTL